MPITRISLQCPVTLEPLYTAVTIMPCMHKINQIAAEHLYGERKVGNFYKNEYENTLCPICRAKVLGYSVDHTFRDIVHLSEHDIAEEVIPLTNSRNPFRGIFNIINTNTILRKVGYLWEKKHCLLPFALGVGIAGLYVYRAKFMDTLNFLLDPYVRINAQL